MLKGMVDISIRDDAGPMLGLVAESEKGASFLGIKLRQKVRHTKAEVQASCEDARKRGLKIQDLTDTQSVS
jgi:hypothetical protein